MNIKVGDKVRLKTYDDLDNQYNNGEGGEFIINTNGTSLYFINEMFQYLGYEYVITNVDSIDSTFQLQGTSRPHWWPVEAIEQIVTNKTETHDKTKGYGSKWDTVFLE